MTRRGDVGKMYTAGSVEGLTMVATKASVKNDALHLLTRIWVEGKRKYPNPKLTLRVERSLLTR